MFRWTAYGSSLQIYTGNATHASNACFQCCHWKSFDNFPCWLCLDFDDLTKNLSLASFCGWFGSDLQSGQTWDSKHTSLFHVRCGDLCELVEEVSALSPH